MCNWGPLLAIIPYLAICFFALLAALATFFASPSRLVRLQGPLPLGDPARNIGMDASGAVAAFVIVFVFLALLAPKELYQFKQFCEAQDVVSVWEIHVPVRIYGIDGQPRADGFSLERDAALLLEPKNHDVSPDETLILKYPLSAKDISNNRLPALHLVLNKEKHVGGHLSLADAAIKSIDPADRLIEIAQPILVQMLPTVSEEKYVKKERPDAATDPNFKNLPAPAFENVKPGS